MRKLLILIFSALIFLSQPLHAGKFYKWVDSEGNTHYTSTPPPETAVSEEKIKTSGGSNVTYKVKKKGRGYYCGNRRVPYYPNKPGRILSNINNQYDGWIETRNNLRKQIAQRTLREVQDKSKGYRKSQNNNYIDGLNKRMAAYSCLIDWAMDFQSGRNSDSLESNEDYARLKGDIKKLTARRKQECGARPEGFGDKPAKWYDCVREYDAQIHKKKRDMDMIEKESR
ncbi:MAG: hypothetical protein BMS9Abin26_1438 [Gammaproteobacteria bacterium]|nr:MAG: hypothetical protein BMS9Abin26_1438 [Gammaproteobacteria bacterium]